MGFPTVRRARIIWPARLPYREIQPSRPPSRRHGSMTHLTPIDYLLMLVYFAVVLTVGWMLRRSTKTSTDFFLSGRSIPSWVAGLASTSATRGPKEVIGGGASGAKSGIPTSHFYWIGAIPAMVFVGLFMMPFYYGSPPPAPPPSPHPRFYTNTPSARER